MKFHRLIKESKLFWPTEIIISDGCIDSDNSGYFPTLNVIWNFAEKNQDKINPWHEIMSWAIYCGFHKLACERINDKNPTIYFHDLDFKYVELKFTESLYMQNRKNKSPLNYPKQIRRQYRRHYS